ncbi:unnamed protein product [Notodromas monacha]|uniref:choline-phosphate cytidylyltransferase n=1 Tax=Notodromas monacha TaxID=399045 RepID=A0A7R9BVG3_9CRUS|nr:unnamed protein product [Notodromas monacha]CAG0922512.1 unnamed protein product [Notodromas monacha]
MKKNSGDVDGMVYITANRKLLGQEACLKYKGPNVQPNETRYEAVRHCKHVDEVFPDFPFGCMTLDTLQTLKIDFIAHDELPCLFPGTTDAYKHVKAAGRFVTTSRTLGISTTDIVARIVKKYEEHPLLFK